MAKQMTYHVETEKIECTCGKIISGPHSCSMLSIIKCYNCERCKHYIENKPFYDQWSFNEDKENVCSECHEKCEFGKLPKGCHCAYDRQWETNKKGECVCPRCESVCEFGDLPKDCKCPKKRKLMAIGHEGNWLFFIDSSEEEE